MCFQFSFESLSVYSSFNVYWQLIPDAWCSDGEGTFAERFKARPGTDSVVSIRSLGGCSSIDWRGQHKF